jgi:hypothetical protein
MTDEFILIPHQFLGFIFLTPSIRSYFNAEEGKVKPFFVHRTKKSLKGEKSEKGAKG